MSAPRSNRRSGVGVENNPKLIRTIERETLQRGEASAGMYVVPHRYRVSESVRSHTRRFFPPSLNEPPLTAHTLQAALPFPSSRHHLVLNRGIIERYGTRQGWQDAARRPGHLPKPLKAPTRRSGVGDTAGQGRRNSAPDFCRGTGTAVVSSCTEGNYARVRANIYDSASSCEGVHESMRRFP